MKSDMRKTPALMVKATRVLMFLFLVLCIPLSSSASEMIYTIQTGSFIHGTDAQKQFDAIVKK
jgi:preprotein translocase subunit SecG